MKVIIRHAWDLTETEASELQRKLSSEVVEENHLRDVGCVAGVDVAYDEQRRTQFAAAVVMDAEKLHTMETATARAAMHFPYIPGLLSFRELPAVIEALEKLKTSPDLIVCDGQGRAHPRRFGLASHLGVIFNVPTIGCSKTRLIGCAEEPGPRRGDRALLLDNEEIIGCVLRTQANIKPVYVSIGHRVSLDTACDWIMKLSPCCRLPETTRHADRMARIYQRQRRH